jgi:hypothetical protein
MATTNELLKERVQLVETLKRLQAEQGKSAAKLTSEYIKTLARVQEIVKIQMESKLAIQDSIKGIIDIRDGATSLSAIYTTLNKSIVSQTKLHGDIAGTLQTQKDNQGTLSDNQKFQHDLVESMLSHYESQTSLATELADLTEEDTVQRSEILDQMDSITDKLKEESELMDARFAGTKQFLSLQEKIEQSVSDQREEATRLSSLSEKQRKSLESVTGVIDKIKTGISGIGSTITTFLQRPQTAIGAVLVGIGHWEHKVTDVNKELGFTILDMNSAAKSAGLLGFIFDDVAGTVKAITNEFGTLESATLKTQFRVGAMASLMGISNTEAAQLVGQFARMNGGSKDIAADMVQTTKEYAKQNNVIPSQVLSDLAGSAEEFALFAKDGGENMIKAATGARMLGTDLGTVSGIAEGLLDFESSMTKELELGAMLGKNINLSKARQLAYDDDILGATTEVLKQVGGIEAFNKMDYFQKKQTADLLGISVAEMKKMATNQENIGDMASVTRETFSDIGAGLNMITNKYLGTGIEMLGGWIAGTTGVLGDLSQMGVKFSGIKKAFSWLGDSVGGIVKGTGNILKNVSSKAWALLSGAGGESVAGGAVETVKETITDKLKDAGSDKLEDVGDSMTDKLKDKVLGGGDDGGEKALGKGSITDKLGKINMTAVLKGAAALVIVAGAVWVFGKAVQEFADVEWPAVFKAILGMAALTASVITLGLVMAGPAGAAMLWGAGAMIVVAGAVWILGKAIQEMAIGFTAMDKIGSTITSLVSQIGGITSLSVAFMGLAGSIGALGVASLLAMPALMGLGIAGKGISVVSNLFNPDEKSQTTTSNTSLNSEAISTYENKMLSKMDNLINAVSKNRDIYLDKEKVTSIVRKTSDKQTTNSGFGLRGT